MITSSNAQASTQAEWDQGESEKYDSKPKEYCKLPVTEPK